MLVLSILQLDKIFKGQESITSFFYSFPWCLAWHSTEWIFNQSWQTRGHRGQVCLSHGFVKGEKAPKRRKLLCYFQPFEGWALEAQNGSWHWDRAQSQSPSITWHVLSPQASRVGDAASSDVSSWPVYEWESSQRQTKRDKLGGSMLGPSPGECSKKPWAFIKNQ